MMDDIYRVKLPDGPLVPGTLEELARDIVNDLKTTYFHRRTMEVTVFEMRRLAFMVMELQGYPCVEPYEMSDDDDGTIQRRDIVCFSNEVYEARKYGYVILPFTAFNVATLQKFYDKTAEEVWKEKNISNVTAVSKKRHKRE